MISHRTSMISHRTSVASCTLHTLDQANGTFEPCSTPQGAELQFPDTPHTSCYPLQLHPVWLWCERVPGMNSTFSTVGDEAMKYRVNTGALTGQTIQGETCVQHFVVHPNSLFRVLWDMTSLLILGYDLFWVPFQVFNPSHTWIVDTAEWVIFMFWALDAVASFLTGYHHDSIVEMRPSKIAQRYMTSWFLFDALLLGIDGVNILLMATRIDSKKSLDGIQMVRVGKSLRIVRILRSFRLLRLMKLQYVLHEFMEGIRSQYLRTILDIVLLLVFMMIFIHFIACGWYAIGCISDSSWVFRAHVQDKGISYHYATSLHWSMAQLTLSSIEIHAGNLGERLFSIAVLILALVLFSSFVSSITNGMNYLRRIGGDAKKQQILLRQYFHDNRISAHLANCITSYLAKKHFGKKRRTFEMDVEVLALLPENLTVLLHLEVFLPILRVHPLFYQIANKDWVSCCEICHFALTESVAEVHRIVFQDGQLATRMYFVMKGSLDYRKDDHVVQVDEQYISELVLWVRWAHHGRLAANSTSDLVELDAQKFQAIVLHRPEWVVDAMRTYAHRLLKQLEEKPSAISDLPLEFDVLQEAAQTACDVMLSSNATVFAGKGKTLFRRSQVFSTLMLPIIAFKFSRGKQRTPEASS